jgi:hypothetical protein
MAEIWGFDPKVQLLVVTPVRRGSLILGKAESPVCAASVPTLGRAGLLRISCQDCPAAVMIVGGT